MNYSGVDWQKFYLKFFESGKNEGAFRVDDAYKRSRFASSIRQYIVRHELDFAVNVENGLVIVRKVSA